ncbi:hypothetical protein L1987_51615 [Smallanthus sonchifolius]|uniref:Uncharacterized protein n=1 Tax=Smallanthus sonchifolius TaxID=185202 RepID=A0ACB9ERG4_9ASTR|nr:hypothetical protein L1987_51615 [Smallanthus sonchifolius]
MTLKMLKKLLRKDILHLKAQHVKYIISSSTCFRLFQSWITLQIFNPPSQCEFQFIIFFLYKGLFAN